MHVHCTTVFLMLLGIATLPGTAVAEPTTDEARLDPVRIDQLIADLGDEDFAARQAATDELKDIGEPALMPLRRAIASSRDLEVRWRAETIARSIAVLPVGRWKVEFANGVVEVCEVGRGGEAAVEEPLRSSRGTAVARDGVIVMTFLDDRLERWTWEGEQLAVEHWFPSAAFPTAPPVLGIARRVR